MVAYVKAKLAAAKAWVQAHWLKSALAVAVGKYSSLILAAATALLHKL